MQKSVHAVWDQLNKQSLLQSISWVNFWAIYTHTHTHRGNRNQGMAWQFPTWPLEVIVPWFLWDSSSSQYGIHLFIIAVSVPARGSSRFSGFHLPPKKHTGRWIGDFKSPLVEKYHVVRCYGPASRSGRVPRIDSTVVLTRIKHSLKGIILFICSRLPFRAIYRPKVHSPHTLLSLHVSIVTVTSPSPCEQRR